MTAQVQEPGAPIGPRFDKPSGDRAEVQAAAENAVQERDDSFRLRPIDSVKRKVHTYRLGQSSNLSSSGKSRSSGSSRSSDEKSGSTKTSASRSVAYPCSKVLNRLLYPSNCIRRTRISPLGFLSASTSIKLANSWLIPSFLPVRPIANTAGPRFAGLLRRR